MGPVIQLRLGGFMHSHGIKGHTKSWKAREHDHQCGDNQSIANGKSQRLRKESFNQTNKLSVIRPGLAKIIGKVCIS
jgi:hypothetical protein